MRRKSKRIGRKELIQKIKELSSSLYYQKELQHELELKLENAYEQLDNIASDPRTVTFDGVPCEEIVVTPQAYGDYMLICDDSEQFRKEYEDMIHKLLAENIVEGLIKARKIQFIHKSPDQIGGPLDLEASYGAKLYVIPWDQVCRNRTFRRRLEGGQASG